MYYLCIEDELSNMIVYISAALMMKFSNKTKKMNMEQIMAQFQGLPTEGWGEEDMKLLLAEAHLYKESYPLEILGHSN